MGDISIIARRLGDGHVQYGWSGNGGYYSMVGARLLDWYQDPKDVEYLFSLGQTGLIGRKGSEHGGYSFFESHRLTGEAFWLGIQNDLFSVRSLLSIMVIFMMLIINGTILFLGHSV